MAGLLSLGIPLGLALIINTLAEWALLSRDNSLELALAKSVKAIVIPLLIAVYALVIANAIDLPGV